MPTTCSQGRVNKFLGWSELHELIPDATYGMFKAQIQKYACNGSRNSVGVCGCDPVIRRSIRLLRESGPHPYFGTWVICLKRALDQYLLWYRENHKEPETQEEESPLCQLVRNPT
jgi:hypothetical protein